jgi:hypothetical protein
LRYGKERLPNGHGVKSPNPSNGNRRIRERT